MLLLKIDDLSDIETCTDNRVIDYGAWMMLRTLSSSGKHVIKASLVSRRSGYE